jgi:hypothetical protein
MPKARRMTRTGGAWSRRWVALLLAREQLRAASAACSHEVDDASCGACRVAARPIP